MSKLLTPAALKAGMVVQDVFDNQRTVRDVALSKGAAVIQYTDGTKRSTALTAKLNVVQDAPAEESAAETPAE